jgi:outer membrane receptor protein involved in Fe transport
VNKAALAVNLKPIKADQVELGIRGDLAPVSYNVVIYHLRKRDDLVSQRDLTTNVTTTVNAGETEHRGIEVGFGSALGAQLRIDAALSYAKHEYVDWVTATADFSGKEIEFAPRQLGNVRLTWTPVASVFAQLEWISTGSYYLEASNSPTFPKYPGHDLLNLRASWAINRMARLSGRVLNVTDRRYADSAQVSSNTPVYSPGLPRSYYAALDLQW